MNFIQQFIRDEQGVTMIEYGLIGAVMAVITLAAADMIATGVANKVEAINSMLSNTDANSNTHGL